MQELKAIHLLHYTFPRGETIQLLVQQLFLDTELKLLRKDIQRGAYCKSI